MLHVFCRTMHLSGSLGVIELVVASRLRFESAISRRLETTVSCMMQIVGMTGIVQIDLIFC